MIDEIDIFHESHSAISSAVLMKSPQDCFCVVPYHHEVVVKLGEHCQDPLAKHFIAPRGRTPVF